MIWLELCGVLCWLVGAAYLTHLQLDGSSDSPVAGIRPPFRQLWATVMSLLWPVFVFLALCQLAWQWLMEKLYW